MARGSFQRAWRPASAAGLFVAATGLFAVQHLDIDLPGCLALVLWAVLALTAADALRRSPSA